VHHGAIYARGIARFVRHESQSASPLGNLTLTRRILLHDMQAATGRSDFS
jgi:hypothetical protein